MEPLSREDRQTLLKMLKLLPNIDDKAVRDNLLSGLPEALVQNIIISSPASAHLNAMIDVVNGAVWARLPDSSWPVLQLIENAMIYVADSSLEGDLQALRDRIQGKLIVQPPAKVSIAPTTVGQAISSVDVDSRPNNLPSQSTPLIGRQQEVLKCCNLLRRDDVRLLTLTGPGGTGKTRLSTEIAYQLLNDFEQGVFFVTLAPISDPKLVAAEIAQTYGLKESGNLPLLESLKTFLQNKHMLLLLDNFERVVEASQLMIELLDACRSLKVLITSRRKLGIRLEREFRVPPLAPPNEKQLLQPEKELVGKLANNEAVNFFIERARADIPEFDITRNNARDIAEICIQLSGLPLAIELAAARIKIHSPYEIKSQLRDRLKLLKLSSNAPDREPRHRSIEAAIDWSYDLLDENERTMFRRLSVFTGGWTMKATEALSLPQDTVPNSSEDVDVEVEGGLSSLINNNLVLTAVREDADGERRFNMLETIREYGLERLKSSYEEDEIRRRHAQFFLNLAEEAEPKLNSAERNLWMERLEVEYDNIRTSLHWMIDHGEAVLGLRMGGALWRFWYIRSYFKEGREWLTKLLALPSGSAAKEVRANALNGAGNLAYNQGDYSAAESFHRECLEIRRELGNEQGVAGSLNNLGLIVRYRGAYEQASEYYEEALRINRRLGNRTWEALNLDNWGNIAYDQGNIERTRELYEASLSIFAQMRDSWGMAMVECDLANVLRDLKNLNAAQKLYEESLARQSIVGDRKVTAAACVGLGHIASEQEYFTTARTRFEEGLKLSRDIDDQQSIINALEGFAALSANQAQPERAFCLAGAAASLRHNLGINLSPAGRQRLNAWLALAKDALSEEDIARARRMGWRFTVEQAIAYAMEQAKPIS